MDHLIRRGLTGVMTTGWATAALVAATITNGLMAGLFAAYSYAVMPGLGRTGDATFVEAMQQSNAAILNGWFGVCFGGSAVFAAAAVLLHLGRPGLPWIVAGLVLYVAVLVITFRINVPLNDRLAAAGTPARRRTPRRPVRRSRACGCGGTSSGPSARPPRSAASSARWSSAGSRDPGRGLRRVKGALRTRCGSRPGRARTTWRHGDHGGGGRFALLATGLAPYRDRLKDA